MKIKSRSGIVLTLAATSALLVASCAKNEMTIHSGNLKIEVNDQMLTLISSDSSAKPLMKDFQP